MSGAKDKGPLELSSNLRLAVSVKHTSHVFFKFPQLPLIERSNLTFNNG